jgi:3-methyl-2-oxobutanoate hydroxymethyltransferase
MGHVGLTPQSVNRFGGHKVQGRGDDADYVLRAAKQLDEQGAFSIVLELIPAALAKEITSALSIPTIGIGAGIECDGQIQVLHDVLGLSERTFKHAKPYMNGRDMVSNALKQYASEVRTRAFPEDRNAF